MGFLALWPEPFTWAIVLGLIVMMFAIFLKLASVKADDLYENKATLIQGDTIMINFTIDLFKDLTKKSIELFVSSWPTKNTSLYPTPS